MSTLLPIVWTIAGSDSGGGAGIQADLHTFQDLNVYGCSVITALTAQNSTSVTNVQYTSHDNLSAQLDALHTDLPAKALKLGMLGQKETVRTVATYLNRYEGFVVVDPVMLSTSGAHLMETAALTLFCEEIIPRADLLTPNLPEAEALLGHSLDTSEKIQAGAKALCAMGAKSVLIKGGHGDSAYCQDYWTDGSTGFWLTTPRHPHNNNHGSGCTLSAAITACMATGHDVHNSLVIAKAYVSAGIRNAAQYGKGPGATAHCGWPADQSDFPWVTATAQASRDTRRFPSCGPTPLGFYPIVDSYNTLKTLEKTPLSTVQLRIKNGYSDQLDNEIKQAVALATKKNWRLFINDHWQLALKYNAYGVHLGQDDLVEADLDALLKQGLRLGVSTHDCFELARALGVRPSYIARGPVYPTTTKQMRFKPCGIQTLQYWCNTLDARLVAIGGINQNRLPAVMQTGVDGVAVISALSQSKNREKTVSEWVTAIKKQEKKPSWHVLGLGALGSVIAERLHRSGQNVTGIIRTQPSERIVEIDGAEQTSTLQLAQANEDDRPIERLILATKSYDILSALASIAHRLTDKTTIILIQNGMGIEAQVRAHYPHVTLIRGLTTIAAMCTAPAHSIQTADGALWLGTTQGPHTDLAQRIVDDFQCAGFQAHWDDQITHRLWTKLAINCTINPLTALFDCNNGALLDSSAHQKTMQTICEEIAMLAQALHINLSANELFECATNTAKMTADNMSSMLQDKRRGTPTEIDVLNGFVVQQANRLGLSVPENKKLLEALS